MPQVGEASSPLRVAIIGAGPAGFYIVTNLQKQKGLVFEVDMFDRLPTPYGLVRAGVAPDHQKYKTVTRVYDELASSANFRFYGGVEYGRDLTLADLKRHYHQVVFATGAQTDRNMGVPGEELIGSHSATDFVAWYNGHPDYVDCKFDFSCESAAVVGLGNVAVDVARILCKTPEELATTDMADYALEALRESRIREVYILGRRGPAQAAFTTPEIKEMGELEDASIFVPKEEAKLDPLSAQELAESSDRNRQKNVAVVQEFAARAPENKAKRVVLRFLVSPVEVLGDDAGRVSAVRLVKNEPYLDDRGTVRPRATDQFETLPVGILFRSVGYRGLPLAGIPFDERSGVIPNDCGRVLEDGQPLAGLYTAGWIKRGPTGVIGTNKTDAQETVACMIEDLADGKMFAPEAPGVSAMENLVRERQPRVITYDEWREIDAEERRRGEESGRPRVKFTSLDEMLKLLGR